MCAKKCDKKDQSTKLCCLFGINVICKPGIHDRLGPVKQFIKERGFDTCPIHIVIQYIQYISPTPGVGYSLLKLNIG